MITKCYYFTLFQTPLIFLTQSPFTPVPMNHVSGLFDYEYLKYSILITSLGILQTTVAG